MLKFELSKKGEKFKDLITGFQGVITARVEYLDEPPQYFVEDKGQSKWLPESRLEAV